LQDLTTTDQEAPDADSDTAFTYEVGMIEDDENSPACGSDDTFNLNPVIGEMTEQNDRGAAITGGVFLEENLKKAIELEWPPVSKTVRDKIFGGYGPLATFSSKILIANAMGVLDSQSRADCDKIRLIRNLAAHTGVPFSFDNPNVEKLINEIECVRRGPIDNSSESHRRNLFTSAVFNLVLCYLPFQHHLRNVSPPRAAIPAIGSTLPRKHVKPHPLQSQTLGQSERKPQRAPEPSQE